jgi:hypothetical protein
MSSNSAYRLNAEDCLRMAASAQDERDKPFWIALAQSWLQLAEHSATSRRPSKGADRSRVSWG